MSKKYTPIQERVINLFGGFNMVLAGPGCGKTDILSERISRASKQRGIPLSDMLCLTFTNRAARGMFSRIKDKLDGNTGELFVGNIHRYCSHFVFDNSIVSADSVIMDENDQSDVLESVISKADLESMIPVEKIESWSGVYYKPDWAIVHNMLGIDIYPSGASGCIKKTTLDKIYKAARNKVSSLGHLMFQIANRHPKESYVHNDLYKGLFNDKRADWQCFYDYEALDYYNRWINKMFNGNNVPSSLFIKASTNEGTSLKVFLYLAAKLSYQKEKMALLDFDDLLIIAYDAYLKDTDKKYKRYPWIQVDEVQDLSQFQLNLIDLLIDRSSPYTVLYLGDEQQAIYSFLGADIHSLSRLKERCKGNLYRLDKNFRSPNYLLSLYNDYAIKEMNMDPDLLPQPKDDKVAEKYDLAFHVYKDEDEECNKIVDRVLPFLDKTAIGNERTALLVPWNSDANAISSILDNKNIRHFKISGTDVFSTIRINDILSHLNVIFNEFNHISWSRILTYSFATDGFTDASSIVMELRDAAMTPSDLMREDEGTYLMDFCNCFDNKEIVVFDTETTGVDFYNDDIVQIAAIKIRNGRKIPDSEFNIFLHTDKHIPEMLGDLVNPMIENYAKADKWPRTQGLIRFMNYIGDSILIGHNVKYDYNILQNNLKRDCPGYYDAFIAKTFDTLKLSHLLYPRMRKYKLVYLLEKLNLQGQNSHMADDDIIATYELAKHCREVSRSIIPRQLSLLQKETIINAKADLCAGYADLYKHAIDSLYSVRRSTTPALVDEIIYADNYMHPDRRQRMATEKKFPYIIDFITNDVVQTSETNSLYAHLDAHLMDLSTFREGDLCDSSVVTERIFVSTVHKAKGLEFENVVIMRAAEGRYPSFAARTKEMVDEGRRLLYVGLSRAMRRLVITSATEDGAGYTPFIEKVQSHFCIRFELKDATITSGDSILAEIWKDTLSLITYKSGIKVAVNNFNIYNYTKTNTPMNLVKDLMRYCRTSDPVSQVKQFLSKFS